RGRDEIGLLFAQLNRAAARLGRARAAIDADRARLEEIVAERTRALREANVRLAAIDTERRRFFADVGHELRTPLTVILAETELNLVADPAPQDARTAFATIRTRAQRLNRRIDDILRVARSETGQIELRCEPFDLGEAALGALDDVEGVARRRRVAITPLIGPRPAVQGDRDWTRQVVAGFLENAIRLSPEDGRIRLDLAHNAGGGAVLSVTDEGPGIAAAERERIFERFARGADQRGNGFGVGLALARWVVERQSGRIEVRSPAPRPVGPDARGPGAEFRLCLPPACDRAAGPRKGGAT
ncbi:MAG: HAMP domain-containing sensor histidine kinase, partial [Thermohalobaculum sp.]|nr:HAMP domain-containing sensor histidine kinase [Thermohalobaculum sp.]